jgi:transcriptional regulator with XRE-family HTH domain
MEQSYLTGPAYQYTFVCLIPHKTVCIHQIAMPNESENRAGTRPLSPRRHADKHDALIGEKIRARRKRIGFSQAQLGAAIGLAFQQVRKYECGINRVSAAKLFDIANALGVDVGYFYDALVQPVPALGDRPQKGHGALPPERRSPTRPDPEAEDLLALFQDMRSAKHRRQLLELARSFVEAGSLQEERDARSD